MNYCTTCGTQYGEHAVAFCTACGAPRAAQASSGDAVSATQPTPNTGASVVARTSAGSQQPPHRQSLPTDRARRKSGAGAFVALGLLFVAVAALSVTFATKSPTAATPPTATQFATPSPTAATRSPAPSPSSSDEGANWSATTNNPATLACRRDLPGGRVLAVGDGGDNVLAVQWALATLKYETRNGSGQLLPMTGDYDSQTSSAVSRFQAKHQLPATGSVDQPTWTAINTQLQTWGSPTAC